MTPSKYIIFGLLGVAVATTSCKKWLTVQPRTQMTAEVLLTTQNGFQDALTGAYIQMKSNSSYGLEMTYGATEKLISSWDVTANTTDQRIGLFNFADEGVQSVFSSIFGQQYKVISSLNSILGQIDNKKEVFSDGGYEMVKGEALALRAFCHFDVLRLFGPVPGNSTSEAILPYVKNLSNVPNDHLNYDQFKTNLLKDLSDAAALLKDIDPFLKYSQTQLANPNSNVSDFRPESNYMGFRYLRMNYYAVKALQARAYLWFGENDLAYEAAKEVIDAKNPDGNPKFALATSATASGGNLNFSGEHIFGLYDFNLRTKFENHFLGGVYKKGTAVTTIKTTLYGNTGTDIRETYLWELITLSNQAKAHIIKKYASSLNESAPAASQVPMIRISEMYLIAVETAPADQRQSYWDAFRVSRNIPVSVLPADPTQLQLEVIKEYRKEFYAEGQAFFAYKRINAPKTAIVFVPAAANVNYVVPLPLNELVQK